MSRAGGGAREHRKVLAKLSAFAVVMLVVLAGLLVVFSEYRSGDFTGYKAVFTDASGLEQGDKVRIAGVEVGKVGSVKIADGNVADVEFEVESDQVVQRSTQAVVRYENLTGDRYLELRRGTGDQSPLEEDGTLPVDQTSPALDLDALLGGFRPLFKALDPGQVNQLSESIVKIFQGESGNVQDLLASTSSLTTTLADRDKLIGDVITNLNGVLTTVEKNHDSVDSIVVNLQQLITGLARNAEPIGQSVTRLNDASANMTTLLTDVRPPLQADVQQLDRVAGLVNNDEAYVDGVIKRLPDDFQKMSRLGAYGSFYNFYLCGVTVRFTNPATGKDIFLPQYEQKLGRCSFDG